MNEIESLFYKYFCEHVNNLEKRKCAYAEYTIGQLSDDWCNDIPIDIFIYDKYATYQYIININAQDKIKNYRTDFTIRFMHESGFDFIFGVEIDGYDYHSTKQQLQYDKKRERDLVALGIQIVRFTGTEVFCNPSKAVDDFFNTSIGYISSILMNTPNTAIYSVEKDLYRERMMQ